MYEDVCNLCLNTEKVMGMVSKELLELDKNTVQFMIDEMQDEIDGQKVLIQEMGEQLQAKELMLHEQKVRAELAENELERLREELAKARN